MPSKVELKLLSVIIHNPGKTSEELKSILWPRPCRCGSIQHYLGKLEKRGLAWQRNNIWQETTAGEDLLRELR